MPAELDIENFPVLLEYLRSSDRIAPGESPRLTNLAGGVSNRTVLLERESGESWVLKQALDRLRVAVEWHSDPARIEREAQGMQRLAEIAPPGAVTPLIFVDPAHHVLAMRAVPRPHENWKAMLLAGRLESAHVRQFAQLLAAVHRTGYERRGEFRREFDDRSHFESLRLEPYYLYSAQRMPFAAPFIERLVRDTRQTRFTLVHGDYSPKNVLVHEDRLVLLDHEVIHFGDGAFDLGFALTHLLSKAHHLRERRSDFANAARTFWLTYRRTVGDVPWAPEIEPRAVRHTLACLLARCIGRSPLEYFRPETAARQANVASSLMERPPAEMLDFIEHFVRGVES
jgi:aminoglycoside phosphotransferase (APT) family kinase protein